MTLKFNRVLEVVEVHDTVVQNFIKLSAVVTHTQYQNKVVNEKISIIGLFFRSRKWRR